MELFFTGILILILSGVLALFFNENLKLKVISIGSCIASFIFLKLLLFNPEVLTVEIPFLPFGNVVFEIDSLSRFFIILISIVTSLVSIYADGYMQPYLNKGKKVASHCFFFPLLTAAMLMVVTVQNAFFFLIVWELMSLASFFLVIFEDDKKEVLSAGIKYLIYMHISVIFIIAAFALMSVYSGSYDFVKFRDMFVQYPYLKDIVFILAFIGFGTKAGFFPVHNWLPDAHPAAPSHVSAVMSSIMIKTGIYGILRVLQIIGEPTAIIAYTILFISVITALYGIIYAINQKDIKKLLAYSSVENIGLIGIAIAALSFGLLYHNDLLIIFSMLGCFLHILNHSIFKSLLFMGAGSVYLKTHTKNIELLGGLIKKMPYTAVFFLFAVIAICAFPPLNGFVGEFFIYTSLLYMMKISSSSIFVPAILSIASTALVGTLVILAMSKLFSITFLGLPRSEHSKEVQFDVPKSMLIPMGILAVFTLVIPILLPFVSFLIVPFKAFCNFSYGADIDLFAVLNVLLQMIYIPITLIILIGLIILVRFILVRKSAKHETWGCGYDKGNNHIQYTASSFVSPFTSILTPLFKKIFDVKKPKGLFPKDAHYNATVEDVEEAYIINPVLKFDEKFLSKFERLQDGNIQHYILYGLIFLILILIGVVIC